MKHALPRMAWSAGMLMLVLSVLSPGTRAAASTATQPSTSGSPNDPGAAALDDAWSSPDVAAPRMDAQPLARRDKGGTWNATGAGKTRSTSAAWLRTTLALGGVVGLILLLGWGYRRVAGGGSVGLALRGRQPGLIEVVSRANISPRHSLCLVRVGPRLVLLGCSNDAIRQLDVISDADVVARLAGDAARQRADSHTAEFSRVLEAESRTYHDEESPDETATPDATQLGSVRDKVSQTIERLRAAAAKI